MEKDSTVATPEGIAVGASETQVEAAYGSENRKGNNFIIFRGKGKLAIMMTNGVVTSIMYQYAEQ
jgi:hypothetical protein